MLASLLAHAESREYAVEHVGSHSLARDLAVRADGGAQIGGEEIGGIAALDRLHRMLERSRRARERLGLTQARDERRVCVDYGTAPSDARDRRADLRDARRISNAAGDESPVQNPRKIE